MPREGTKWDGEDKRTYRWKCLVSIAWVAVGWQQGVVQNTRQSQRELGNDQGSTVFFVFLFFFLRSHRGWWFARVISNAARSGEPQLRTRGILSYRVVRALYWYMVRHARGTVTFRHNTHCCLWKWPHRRPNPIAVDTVIQTQEKYARRRRTPHGASRLPGSCDVKTL